MEFKDESPKRCGNCEHARAMPDLKLHVYCDDDGGSVQGSFTPACGSYKENIKRRWIGWGVMKRLAEKKKERLEGEDQNLTGGKL